MKIEVWLDYSCPLCYIGKRQLDLALDHFPHREFVVIQFKGFQSDTNEDELINNYEIGTNKDSISVEQTKQLHDQIHKQAIEVGLTMNRDFEQHIETFDIHRLVKHASCFDCDRILVEQLFKAYFTDGKNIADHIVLTELAKKAGMGLNGVQKILETKKYTNIVQEDIDIANEIGIEEIPFFVFNEKYAVSGAQSANSLQEVLEAVWIEEGEHAKNHKATSSRTTYCCDDYHCEKDE